MGGLGDLLGNLFGGRGGRGQRSARGPVGPQRGHDLETELHLDFLDAVHGITTSVSITSEAPCSRVRRHRREAGHAARRAAPPAAGAGAVAVDQGPFSFSQVCPTCGGRGSVVKDKCKHCKGRGVEVRPRTVKVRIPAGVDDGQRIRVKGRGTPGLNGGPPGDLYVVVHVAPHPIFGRSGKSDLTVKVPITFAEAALGAQVKVPTLDVAGHGEGPAGHAERARRCACAARGIQRGIRRPRRAARHLRRRRAHGARRRRAARRSRSWRPRCRATRASTWGCDRWPTDPTEAATGRSTSSRWPPSSPGVHPQTLRIYERKGLIEPSRTEGRSRRYSDRDIALLQRIQELTNEGVSLAGVRRILELEAELERARARGRGAPRRARPSQARAPGRRPEGAPELPARPRAGPPGGHDHPPARASTLRQLRPVAPLREE